MGAFDCGGDATSVGLGVRYTGGTQWTEPIRLDSESESESESILISKDSGIDSETRAAGKALRCWC